MINYQPSTIILMLITDQLLLAYQRCDRRAFLDVYGDLDHLDKPSDFLQKLTGDTIHYQEKIIRQYSPTKPFYYQGDWRGGSLATLELMKQGVETIYRGVLYQELEGITLVSRPTLLIKKMGISPWGNWLYFPADIRLGKRPKLDYQIVIAFHVYVLSYFQETLPSHGNLLLREKGNYPVNLRLRFPQMLEKLAGLIHTLEHPIIPEVFISRQKCSVCRWYLYCYNSAQSEKHLSLVPGITPSRYEKLKSLNLTTLESLAKTSSDLLAPFPEFSEEIAQQLIQQARSLWQNRPFLLHQFSSSNTFDELYQKIKKHPLEIYFDIEAEPDLNLDYLHGILVVDRVNNQDIFYPFLAENPEEEGLIWSKFLDQLSLYSDAPIYHFCDYEVKTVKRLAKLYKTPPSIYHSLLSRFVDIHQIVTQSVTLPVESYSLKSMARWMGFQWRDPLANGAQCVCWYEQWLKTGDRQFLQSIMIYNEDDCRATYHVKNWLENFFKSSFLPEE